MINNILLNTDSYKASHFLQYPPGTEYVSSYIESRGGKWDQTVFFGLQMFLYEYLTKPITISMVNEADEFFKAHGEPFNRDGWLYILRVHGGYLPIEIEALPEGTVVETRNVLVQLVNTDPVVPWLTSYLETALLRAIWYPVTVATNSFMVKQVIDQYLQETSDDPESELSFKLHDFGSRGVSSVESAMIGGAAHLVNFQGTDTVSGAYAARWYYGADMAGFSVPAAEHSTITAWGGPDEEIKAFENMLDQFAKPGAVVSVVSDSYDIHRAAKEHWGKTLKQKVIDSGATVVVRPDSGDPLVVPITVITELMDEFGFETNSKGYRVLPPCIRVMQGDGVNLESITEILKRMKSWKLSASNIVFGMGGALLQQLDRDTLKFAMKASAICVGGKWRDIYKDPVTDSGKRSKRGRLALIKVQGLGNQGFKTVRKEEALPEDNLLEVVFKNGEILKTHNFEEIRERVKISSLPLDRF